MNSNHLRNIILFQKTTQNVLEKHCNRGHVLSRPYKAALGVVCCFSRERKTKITYKFFDRFKQEPEDYEEEDIIRKNR